MKKIMKKIIQPILLIIVALGIGAFVWDKFSLNPEAKTAADTAETQAVDKADVVVTYFTTDARCVSCKKIESLTRETLQRDFADAMAQGQLRFQTINIDREDNKHYIEDYDLAFKTVVVARQSQEAAMDWEKLDDVWNLLNAPADFAVYVSSAVTKKLDAGI